MSSYLNFFLEMVTNYGSQIFAFILLLGVLIAFHEYGHYLMAKWCGMRVENFSIGFGKKLFKKKVGETEYSFSILPFGGYVKITGQDPREEVPKEIQHRSFQNKKLWQRALVVLGGPVFNLILAFFLYFGIIASGGQKSHAPMMEHIALNSEAYQAGFRTGDKVVSVKQLETGKLHDIKEFRNFESLINENPGKKLEFTIQRNSQNLNITTTPIKTLTRESQLPIEREMGAIPGLQFRQNPSILYVPNESSWMGQRNLKYGIAIKAIEFKDQKIETPHFAALEQAWNKAITNYAATASSGKILIHGTKIFHDELDEKEGLKGLSSKDLKEKTFTLAWTQQSDAPKALLKDNGAFNANLLVGQIAPDMPAQKLGLQAGDLLTSINGVETDSTEYFIYLLQKFSKTADKSMTISWLRNGSEIKSGTITPELNTVTDQLSKTESKKFQIGILFFTAAGGITQQYIKPASIIESAKLGWEKTYATTKSMLVSFGLIFTGKVNPKTLGGPIAIFKIAGRSFKEGIIPFVSMMALLSLNLFILNLLPLPVLDGGHLVLFAIEAITRRPLTPKIVEVWSIIGLVLIVSLMLFTTFNDILRSF